ncbi:DUF1918 domain-containing protein [Actinomadura oligospora]|uniref:DUF1918 domain-containing protein n=1 Tax=Actinomadura oligospora TaxID=111804 RepID=UPI00047B53ED|nr:DUF1918 domain-containing protein [Actinomadura oligospora]
MHAKKGDRVVSRRAGMPEHTVEIIEVLGTNGTPPYRVRSKDGHEVIMMPGPNDTIVRHAPTDGD